MPYDTSQQATNQIHLSSDSTTTLQNLILNLMGDVHYNTQKFWGSSSKNSISMIQGYFGNPEGCIAAKGSIIAFKNIFLSMIRRANASAQATHYPGIILTAYKIALELIKLTPSNQVDNNTVLDPITMAPIDTGSAITLATGYIYNLSSVRHLALRNPIDTGHRLKHQSQNHMSLVQQDIIHIKSDLTKHTNIEIHALPRSTPLDAQAPPEANLLLNGEMLPTYASLATDEDKELRLPKAEAVLVKLPAIAYATTTDFQPATHREASNIDLSHCDFTTTQSASLSNTRALNVNISGANLSNKDLSTLICTKITVDKNTKLVGTKINQEILDKATPESQPFIARAIAATYYKESSWLNLNSWKVWANSWYHYFKDDGQELSSVMDSLNENAALNDNGASCAALKIHGLYSQNSNAIVVNPNAEQTSVPSA
jgi:hypothetical protein